MRRIGWIAIWGACSGEGPERDESPGEQATVPWDTQDWESPVPQALEIDCDTMPTATIPVAFPLPTPTHSQIDEVKDCDLLNQVYDYLYVGSVCPESACEWAAAAVVQVVTDPDYGYTTSFPEAELSGAEAIRLNPAVLLTDLLLAALWSAPKVDAPSAPDPVVTDVSLTYDWTGMGDPVSWEFTVTDGNTSPTLTGTVYGEAWSGTAEAAQVQALGTAFSDLVPIDEWVNVTPCWDTYPDWTMQLTWADGTVRDLATHFSNVVFFGGPWETEIDGQKYLQASPAMVIAVFELVADLDLPFGSPSIFGCGSVVPPIIEQAYP